VDRAIGCGMEGIRIDGNDLNEVLATMKHARKMAQKSKPVIIEAMTFRMRGHEEASGTAYVPKKLFEEWGKKDPILRYEDYLRKDHQVTDDEIKSIKLNLKNLIKDDINKALDCPLPEFDESTELNAVYAKATEVP